MVGWVRLLGRFFRRRRFSVLGSLSFDRCCVRVCFASVVDPLTFSSLSLSLLLPFAFLYSSSPVSCRFATFCSFFLVVRSFRSCPSFVCFLLQSPSSPLPCFSHSYPTHTLHPSNPPSLLGFILLLFLSPSPALVLVPYVPSLYETSRFPPLLSLFLAVSCLMPPFSSLPSLSLFRYLVVFLLPFSFLFTLVVFCRSLCLLAHPHLSSPPCPPFLIFFLLLTVCYDL